MDDSILVLRFDGHCHLVVDILDTQVHYPCKHRIRTGYGVTERCISTLSPFTVICDLASILLIDQYQRTIHVLLTILHRNHHQVLNKSLLQLLFEVDKNVS